VVVADGVAAAADGVAADMAQAAIPQTLENL